MKIGQFFSAVDVYPVFVTARDIKVDSYVWIEGSTPRADPQIAIIRKGTLMTKSWSAFDDGYAMQPVSWRKAFSGQKIRQPSKRWFAVLYKDMDFDHFHMNEA